eukprot:gb/GEZN01010933.1/.p1 GENE.gb/GEZN01010933.1/~~gb/GEZN01010933.1/.p1  ORF type:complete len:249 (-),score=59.24 gb/GEZN01010933.1/:362-1108(-)
MAAEGKKPGEISIGTMKEFEKVNSLNFEAQAIFFLNAFWVEWGDENKERVWILTKDILDVDMQAWVGCGKKERHYKMGSSLDLQWAMKMLEKEQKAITPGEYKAAFKAIDANFDGHMSLIEYLLWESKFTVEQLLSKDQRVMTPAMLKAKKDLEDARAVVKAFEEKKDALRIECSTGRGLAAAKAKQEYEKMCQQDTRAMERDVIKAEAAVNKQEKKLLPPAGQAWWIERQNEERASFMSKAGAKNKK